MGRQSGWKLPERGRPLAPKQEAVLELLAHGYKQSQIAQRLEMSITAVSIYARHAAIQLGATTTTEAVVKYDRMKRG